MTDKTKKKSRKKETPRFAVVFVKIINVLFSIFSILNLFLLLATMGAWMNVLSEIFTKFTVSEPYTINALGAGLSVLWAFLIACFIAMIQVKGKNYVEKGTLVLNFGFLLFIAVMMTIEISAFPFIFVGLGLSFSIIMSILIEPKGK